MTTTEYLPQLRVLYAGDNDCSYMGFSKMPETTLNKLKHLRLGTCEQLWQGRREWAIGNQIMTNLDSLKELLNKNFGLLIKFTAVKELNF